MQVHSRPSRIIDLQDYENLDDFINDENNFVISQLRDVSPVPSTASTHTIGRSPSPPTTTTHKRSREPSPFKDKDIAHDTNAKRSKITPLVPDRNVIYGGYIDSDDEMDDDEIIEHGLNLEQHRLQQAAAIQARTQFRSRRVPIPVRNPAIILPCAEIESYSWNNSTLRSGKTVELKDGTFLRLKSIIQDVQTGDTSLRGWLLKRCTSMKGLFRKGLNELCYVHEVDEDDPRPLLEQSVTEVSLHQVLRIRQLLRTNAAFPAFRFSKEDLPELPDLPEGKREELLKEYVSSEERLVVRWKLTTIFKNAQKRAEFSKRGKYTLSLIRKIEALTEDECNKGCSTSAEKLRDDWRGKTARGGSVLVRRPDSDAEFHCPVSGCQRRFFGAVRLWDHCQSSHRGAEAGDRSRDYRSRDKDEIEHTRRRFESVISVDSDDDDDAVVRAYSFGDGFCCGGGVSSAARMAGFEVSWAFDNDPNTRLTYVRNFPRTKHYLITVHDFCTTCPASHVKVDCMHFSPVCDYFSPNKTYRGCVGDEDKEATLLCGSQLLELCKPRIATVEQTFGLIERWPHHLNTLITDLTQMGYSVSWQVVRFHNLGAPQRRRRLIIIAAGPGETLPDIPPYTHSNCPDDDLRPYESVNSVLARVPRDAPHHDTHNAPRIRQNGGRFEPWDGSGLINCITRGGNISHPSGQRALTIAELAALQSFEPRHIFIGCKTQIRSMIGNAVPPMMMKIIFAAIKKHLQKTDGIEPQAI